MKVILLLSLLFGTCCAFQHAGQKWTVTELTSKPVILSTSTTTTNHRRISSSRNGSCCAKKKSPAQPLFVSPNSASSSSPEGTLDVEALFKYGAALAIQISLFCGLFVAMDNAVAAADIDIPYWANIAFFYAMSLRSRVFNPLSNKRPEVKSLEVEGQDTTRNMPSWTPPGFVFPIMWLLIIGPIRAVTATMVYEETHSYAAPAILALAAHLSIGDVWNTINNVEQRYGTAVTGAACVWLSKANTAYQFSQVSLSAGQIMTIPLVWLTVAFALVTNVWLLNPDAETGKVEPLYPIVGKASTKFAWFEK